MTRICVRSAGEVPRLPLRTNLRIRLNMESHLPTGKQRAAFELSQRKERCYSTCYKG